MRTGVPRAIVGFQFGCDDVISEMPAMSKEVCEGIVFRGEDWGEGNGWRRKEDQ